MGTQDGVVEHGGYPRKVGVCYISWSAGCSLRASISLGGRDRGISTSTAPLHAESSCAAYTWWIDQGERARMDLLVGEFTKTPWYLDSPLMADEAYVPPRRHMHWHASAP